MSVTSVTRMVVVHGEAGFRLREALEGSGFEPSIADGGSVVWLPKAAVPPSPPPPALASQPPLLVDATEAGVRLGVSRSTVYRLIEAGALRSVHVGRSARIAVAELERYVDRLAGRGRGAR